MITSLKIQLRLIIYMHDKCIQLSYYRSRYPRRKHVIYDGVLWYFQLPFQSPKLRGEQVQQTVMPTLLKRHKKRKINLKLY